MTRKYEAQFNQPLYEIPVYLARRPPVPQEITAAFIAPTVPTKAYSRRSLRHPVRQGFRGVQAGVTAERREAQLAKPT